MKNHLEFRIGGENLNDLPSSGKPIIIEKITKISTYIKNFLFLSTNTIITVIGVSLINIILTILERLHIIKIHAKFVSCIWGEFQTVKKRQKSNKFLYSLSSASNKKLLVLITMKFRGFI